jgi:glycine betaine/proline transport system substrate-binding protein
MLSKLLKPKLLGLLVGAIGMVLATACGAAATPTPEPTAVPTATTPPPLEKIMFHDGQWGSNWVHLAVARYVLENGYGYPTEEVQGSTGVQKLTLVEGDVHVNMETWRMNIPEWYLENTEAGLIRDLAGTTHPQTMLPAGSPGQTIAVAGQGFYVPTYMIEGDTERGIEATAPDLKSVQDLRNYKELFSDPNDPGKGMVLNCILGWECQKINRAKWFAYDMYTDFNVVEPGGSAALKAGVVGPYEAGEAFVSYYWQPTDVINLREMTLLEEPKWNAECQEAMDLAVAEEPYEATIGCAFPIGDAHTVVNAAWADRNPQAVQFLTNYYVPPKPLAQMEADKMEQDLEWVEVAIAYLKDNKETWSTWIQDDNRDEIIAELDKALAAE